MIAAGCKVRREEKRAGHRATTCCTKSWRWARPEATRATRVAPIVVSSLHWRGVACGSATRNKPRQRRRFRVNRRYRCRDLLPSRLTGLPEVAVNFQQKSQKSRGATVSIAHFNKHTLVGKVRHSFGRVSANETTWTHAPTPPSSCTLILVHGNSRRGARQGYHQPPRHVA